MNKAFDWKRFRLYLWIALPFCIMGVLFTWHTHPDKFLAALSNNIWGVAYVLVFNFILFEYTVPYVLKRRKTIILNILIGIFLLWLHAMFYSFGSYAWRFLGIGLGTYTAFEEFFPVDNALQNQMGYSVSSVFFFGIIRHIYNYIKLKQATQQLRIEKQSAELNYLKAQTNPHFLFNTLNNIYSLARDKNDLAPESIMRLSKILRFMLYETSGQFISVEQELKIIADYIELEKLRYDESLNLNFNYDLEDTKQALPPLLLMPLVENAFKHGVSESRNSPFVDVHLSIKQRQLIFVVKNSAEAHAHDNPVKENIGLANLRRQLELLYKEYNLTIAQANDVFTATLKINLASHV